jgi:alpha-beta hydrolase superfamily lysophospholipase
MSTELPVRSSGAIETPMARVRYLAYEGRYLFAWHHGPHPTIRRRGAVVLCPPLGSDYVVAYRVWRILAERLAGAGFDVLRFDYEGTGDSSGDLEEPGRLEAWFGNIGRVVEEARALAGGGDVTLVGLRIGATLALHAAASRGGVDRLVLWSPFRSGKAYVRELKAFARLSHKDYVSQVDQGPDILASGYVLPGPIAQALERVDMDGVSTAPAPHILLIDRDDRTPDAHLGEHLSRLGSCVTRIRPEGTAAMLEQVALSVVPEAALDGITGWLSGAPAGANINALGKNRDDNEAGVARGRGYREIGARFGPDDRLFGILAMPEDAGDAPAVILLNTGIEYRVGSHRLYVPLARDLAARGHVVFRYDLGGIGDSAPPEGANENVAYPAHALDDLREAVGLVRDRARGRKVFLVGLCSGAWHAFRAAREALPVDGIVSINPPLYLADRQSWTTRLSAQYQEGRNYHRKLRDSSSWLNALSGRSEYGTFARFVATYVTRRVAHHIRPVVGSWGPHGLADDLEAVSARGIASLFVFSRGDQGLEYFRQFGGASRRWRRHGHIRHVIVDGAGHTFSPPEAQETLRHLVVDFVSAAFTTAHQAQKGEPKTRRTRPTPGPCFLERRTP